MLCLLLHQRVQVKSEHFKEKLHFLSLLLLAPVLHVCHYHFTTGAFNIAHWIPQLTGGIDAYYCPIPTSCLKTKQGPEEHKAASDLSEPYR